VHFSPTVRNFSAPELNIKIKNIVPRCERYSSGPANQITWSKKFFQVPQLL
jgi:hypothetical protein